MNGTKTTIWLYILIAFAVFSAVPDIHAATPSATPIADVAQNEADTINLDVAGSFSDGDGHTLTFTATGLPEGIGISSAGLISGKLPKVTANTSYGVTVTATDPGNLTADQSFALTVINSINELPVLARNTVLRINQDAAAGTIGNNYLQLTDENNPGAGSLTYTLTAVPVKGTLQKGNSALAVGATFTQADIDVGSISFAPSGSANGADGFSFTYTDDFGETQGPAVFTITIVDNIPPTMNGTAVYVDSTHVEVTFSEEVKGADAPANYGAGNDLKISQVAWVSGNIYRLTTSVQTIGVAYTITGNAITDLADNGLAAGSKTATFIRSETANSAPTTPVLKAPASGGANTAGEVSTLTPTLSVNAVTDPDSDPVTYTFEVSTTSDPPVVVAYKEGITAENGAASFTVPTSLAENTIYQWRVQAYDGHLYSGYMPTVPSSSTQPRRHRPIQR
ncbi:cadherin-like domain-containing protein [Geotalea toluenoxydans]|uniref:cadherin-like domain-containing protein n=1 Tax=Geotalea toluenoxydans TaxID=421624 RepID=UPI0006D04979|nr:cadherin-like domain-containing protein [Geotalea toluenoxydans]